MNKKDLLEALEIIKTHNEPYTQEGIEKQSYAITILFLMRYINEPDICKAVGEAFGIPWQANQE